MNVTDDREQDGTFSHSTPAEKVCTGCQISQPLEQYYRQARGLYGRHSRCKACCRAYEQSPRGKAVKARYDRSAKGKVKYRRYRQSEKHSATLSQWRKSPVGHAGRRRERKSEAHRVRQALWRKTAKGKALSRSTAKRFAASPKGQRYRKAYRESGQRLVVQRRYKASQRGLDTSRKDCAARRARATEAGGTFTVTEWLTLCAQYEHRCLACHQSRKLEPDHVIPIARGGTSDISNIQPLCGRCNRSKGAKTIDYRPQAMAS